MVRLTASNSTHTWHTNRRGFIIKISTWDDTTAKRELTTRLRYAKDFRENFEFKWNENEKTIYSTRSLSRNSDINLEAEFRLGVEDVDSSGLDSNVSYAFKNFRFIHAQLSANPPSVIARPTSVDPDDRMKADAADKLVHHAIRQYSMQEHVDKASLNCLLYGTGIFKMTWNAHKGDIVEFDEESGELVLEGDIDISIPSPWDIFIDPDADTAEQIRYIFHKIQYPYEEALARWPEKKKLLDANRLQGGKKVDSSSESALSTEKYDSVELWEYWETGLPVNGYQGRYAIHTSDGSLVEGVRPNPHRFMSPGAVSRILLDDRLTDEMKAAKIEKLPQKARLPFHIFTDIDVPNTIWGKSFVEYVTQLQDNLNRLDITSLDTIAALGVPRAIIPDGAELADDAFSNSPWDIMRVAGNPNHIRFLNPPSVSPDIPAMRDRLKAGIDDVSGVNEGMFGQMNRETSGTAMQYATQQGNMIRRRLFNKYTLFIESIYKTYLNLIRKHWDTEKVVYVLGKEKVMHAVRIKGADIDGGFDLQVEYGTSFSLDPLTRREEILALQPLFEKANVPPRVQLQMLKLNELEGMHDLIQLAENRQKEVFEKMIAEEVYYPPEEFQDHENMIAYAFRYFMTAEFDGLENIVKALCRQHIRERITLAAQEKALAAPAAPPAAPPLGGLPPPPGGLPMM